MKGFHRVRFLFEMFNCDFLIRSFVCLKCFITCSTQLCLRPKRCISAMNLVLLHLLCFLWPLLASNKNLIHKLFSMFSFCSRLCWFKAAVALGSSAKVLSACTDMDLLQVGTFLVFSLPSCIPGEKSFWMSWYRIQAYHYTIAPWTHSHEKSYLNHLFLTSGMWHNWLF